MMIRVFGDAARISWSRPGWFFFGMPRSQQDVRTCAVTTWRLLAVLRFAGDRDAAWHGASGSSGGLSEDRVIVGDDDRDWTRHRQVPQSSSPEGRGKSSRFLGVPVNGVGKGPLARGRSADPTTRDRIGCQKPGNVRPTVRAKKRSGPFFSHRSRG
jgi:hypothetical protein